MSSVIAESPARAPAIHDRDVTDRTDHTDHIGRGRETRPSRIMALMQALADAGACIDPTGVLVSHRLARNPERTQRWSRW